LENLLDFNVKDYLNPEVKSSWSIMKNISSALLVIIMLVAVISQAIGAGPVDAYTIRKILPRLVVAVILIQISWLMLVWFIQVADDFGHGVRDLSRPVGSERSTIRSAGLRVFGAAASVHCFRRDIIPDRVGTLDIARYPALLEALVR
jgi:hypothetical protein